MEANKDISLLLITAFYIFAGVSHFFSPRFFLKIIPKWVPYPKVVNLAVGAIEILLGAAIYFEETRMLAAWGIIALLIVVFPANIYHYQLARQKNRQVIATLIRLPLQLLLIYWAYTFV
ncbi:MauE/DoxX family redox-associated membrane protein [Reichenbachiella sp.]|uniref:DoxX family protein n=1 Tax=Reichenbachiella sp. TaxID=2184521 RepID=UPI003BAE3D2B